MTYLNERHVSHTGRNIILIVFAVVILITFVSIVGIPHDNNWVIKDSTTKTSSKIGYIENVEHIGLKTRIIGTFGNPLGNFDTMIDDPDWKFRDGTRILYTETTVTPVTCINTKTNNSYSQTDMYYRTCMLPTTNHKYEVYQ